MIIDLRNNHINPFTAKFSQKHISTKFHFVKFVKQIAPWVSVSTGRELSLSGHIIGFGPQN